jgi:hypothetical protein
VLEVQAKRRFMQDSLLAEKGNQAKKFEGPDEEETDLRQPYYMCGRQNAIDDCLGVAKIKLGCTYAVK